jgi:hypothetical protein
MTVGAPAFPVRDVAGIGIADAVLHRDTAGHGQGGRRSVRDLAHLPIWMKGCEVHRNVRPELLDHPLRQGLDFLLGIVFSWDEQRRDLEPDLGLVFKIDERLQHRLEMGPGDLMIEPLGEGFEVHIGGIHIPEELGPGFVADIACRHRYGLNASFTTGLCHINRIFVKDDRIVIGVGHAPTTEFRRSPSNRLGRGFVSQDIHFAGLAHVPVLAELAGQITSCRPE